MTELLNGVEAPSDAELISRVRGGDVAAYGELFSRHVDAARRLGRQLVRGPDVDDLVSDAFAKTLQVLQGGGGPDVAFRAYVLTSVRRLHVDRIRAAKKVQPSDDMTVYDDGLPFKDTAVANFESGAAAKAFSSLPERWQLVLWHLEVEGQKPADIAPLLGMSANSVSALAYRAREGLRQAFLTMHLADCPTEQCRWVNEHLGAYVRQGLSRRDTTKVEEHLEGCRRCTAMYVELNEVNSNLAAIIGPLLLGAAAAGYISSSGAGLTGVSALIGRVRDAVGANAGGGSAVTTAGGAATTGGAVTAGGVITVGGVIAAGVAAVTTAVFVLGGGPNEVITEADQPVGVVQTPQGAGGSGDQEGGGRGTARGSEDKAQSDPDGASTTTITPPGADEGSEDDPASSEAHVVPPSGEGAVAPGSGGAPASGDSDSGSAGDPGQGDTPQRNPDDGGSGDNDPGDGDPGPGPGDPPDLPPLDTPPLPPLDLPEVPDPPTVEKPQLPPINTEPQLPQIPGTETGGTAGDTGGDTGTETGGDTGAETGGDSRPGASDRVPGDGNTNNPPQGGPNADASTEPVAVTLTVSDPKIVGDFLVFDLTGTPSLPEKVTVTMTSDPTGIEFASENSISSTKPGAAGGTTLDVKIPLDIPKGQPDTKLSFSLTAPSGYELSGDLLVEAVYEEAAEDATENPPGQGGTNPGSGDTDEDEPTDENEGGGTSGGTSGGTGGVGTTEGSVGAGSGGQGTGENTPPQAGISVVEGATQASASPPFWSILVVVHGLSYEGEPDFALVETGDTPRGQVDIRSVTPGELPGTFVLTVHVPPGQGTQTVQLKVGAVSSDPFVIGDEGHGLGGAHNDG